MKATLVLGMKPINIGDTPQPHAWSCVTINGKKYHVDVTSDDPVPDRPETVSRSCFLVSDTKLNKYGHADYSARIRLMKIMIYLPVLVCNLSGTMIFKNSTILIWTK